jgi:CHAT domain-containing protein/uncharacterized protein HemY
MMKTPASLMTAALALLFIFCISAAPAMPAVKSGSLQNLIRNGSSLIDRGDWEDACRILLKAYEISEREGRKPEMALCQSELGRACRIPGEFIKAAEHYTKALDIYRSLDDRKGIISTLTCLAENSLKAHDYRQAREYCLQVLPHYKSGGNEYEAALLYDLLGQTYFYTREHMKACQYYTDALRIMEARGEEKSAALLLERIGYAWNAEGKSAEARNYFEKALAIFEKLKDKASMARSMQNLGIMYFLSSEYEKAGGYLEKSLALQRESGDRNALADTLSRMATIRTLQSDFNSALHCYEEALAIYQESRNKAGSAEILEKIGDLYSNQGNKGKEKVYLDKAIAIYRETGDKSSLAALLRRQGESCFMKNDLISAADLIRNAAQLYSETGQTDKAAKALAYLVQILIKKKDYENAQACSNQLAGMMDSIKDRKTTAEVYAQLGFTYQMESGLSNEPGPLLEKALSCHKKALAIAEETDTKAIVALYSFTAGDLCISLSRLDEAERYLGKSGEIARKSMQRELLWMVDYKLGICDEMRGNLKAAAEHYRASIAVIEEIKKFSIGNEEEKTEALARKSKVYEALVRVLMKLDKKGEKPGRSGSFIEDSGKKAYTGSTYARQAFYFSEKSKAQTLTEMLMERQADLMSRVDPDLLEKQKQVITNLISMQRDRESSFSGKKREELHLAISLEEEKLWSIREKIKASRPSYGTFIYPDTVDAEEAGRLLPGDTALLEYTIVDDTIYCFVITRQGFTSMELPVKSARVKLFVSELMESVSEAKIENYNSRVARQLYEALLAPVMPSVRTCSHLLIIRDDFLNYLPFEIVMKDDHFLIESHAISYVPSLNFLRIFSKKQESCREYLGIGSPALDVTPYLCNNATGYNFMRDYSAENGIRWSPLPGTKKEIEDTAQLFSGKKLILLGKDATKDRVKKEMGNYSIIHFATHGLLDDRKPILYSALILSGANSDSSYDGNDGYLRAAELLALKIDAELVVLSACRTGLGLSMKSEGLLGLTTSFFYAGARSIIASLWSVEDESTSELFIDFYKNLKNMSCCEALRAAKLSMIEKKRSPFYWAPFIYIGL